MRESHAFQKCVTQIIYLRPLPTAQVQLSRRHFHAIFTLPPQCLQAALTLQIAAPTQQHPVLTPPSRRPHAAPTSPQLQRRLRPASTPPPRYHNAAAMPPQHRSHKQLSRRLTAGSRCPQAAPTPAERFFTQPPHLQHRDTAATPQQRHPHASARRVHAALTQPSRSPHIDPCPPRPPAPPSTSPYISPPYRWNCAATPPRRCPQAAVLNPSAAHAQLHAALTPPPRHTPAGPSDKSH